MTRSSTNKCITLDWSGCWWGWGNTRDLCVREKGWQPRHDANPFVPQKQGDSWWSCLNFLYTLRWVECTPVHKWCLAIIPRHTFFGDTYLPYRTAVWRSEKSLYGSTVWYVWRDSMGHPNCRSGPHLLLCFDLSSYAFFSLTSVLVLLDITDFLLLRWYSD